MQKKAPGGGVLAPLDQMVYVEPVARLVFVLALLASLCGVANAALPQCTSADVCCASASGPEHSSDRDVCTDCACCSHAARPLLAPPATDVAPLWVASAPAEHALPRVSASVPRDIFHVPKPL